MSLSGYQISLVMLGVLALPITFALILIALSSIFKIDTKWQGLIFGLPLVIGAVAFLLLPIPAFLQIQVREFMVVDEMPYYLGILIDSISGIMSMVILLITGLIGIYSSWYFHDDSSKKTLKFYAGLGLFATSMLGLCMSSSLIAIFIFWELVGFSSWWIVGYYNEEQETGGATSFIFLTNRFADIGLLLTIIIFLSMINSTEILEINQTLLLVDKDYPIMKLGLLVAGSGIVIAAMGKSAQGIFMLWLPRAMIGPTPASALMHAATLVTAGVILISRTLTLIPIPVLHVLVVVSLITAVVAGYFACRVKNIKEILALSTIAQLGIMFAGFSSFQNEMPLLHLFTHAFFKAGLFLSAGILIKQSETLHDTDTKNLNILASIPLSYPFAAAICIMLASLLGLPSTASFISKGALYHEVIRGQSFDSDFIYYLEIALFLLANIATGAYVNRVIYYFTTTSRTEKIDNPVLSVVNTVIIGLLAICSTWLVWSVIYLSPNEAFTSLKIPSVHWFEELILLPSTLIGMAIGWIWANKEKNIIGLKSPILTSSAAYLGQKIKTGFISTGKVTSEFDSHFIDTSVAQLARFMVVTGHVIYTLDRIFVDGIVKAFAGFVKTSGRVMSTQFHSGKVQTYISTLIAIVLLLAFFMIL